MLQYSLTKYLYKPQWFSDFWNILKYFFFSSFSEVELYSAKGFSQQEIAWKVKVNIFSSSSYYHEMSLAQDELHFFWLYISYMKRLWKTYKPCPRCRSCSRSTCPSRRKFSFSCCFFGQFSIFGKLLHSHFCSSSEV